MSQLVAVPYCCKDVALCYSSATVSGSQDGPWDCLFQPHPLSVQCPVQNWLQNSPCFFALSQVIALGFAAARRESS